jgi:choline transport protein
LVTTLVITSLLACIPIGSSVAYNNVTSLGLGALLSSYLICIGCVVLKRIRNQPLLPRRFTLGKAGLPINILSLAFLLLLFVMIFFPSVPDPVPSTMNWAVLMYGGVLILSVVYFLISGRKSYVGPVEYVRKLE